MKLIVINSNSSGNAYALDSGSDILLIEAGIRHSLVTKAIGFRNERVVGCLVSHAHGDHAKYAEEYAGRGVKIYCNKDVSDKKQFSYGACTVIESGTTYTVGTFHVMPLTMYHDVETYGFLIYHRDMGTLVFASDTYKMDAYIKGVNHWLIEANYDDRILKANVEDGKVDRAQANRLMLSHLSIDNTIHYLRECSAKDSDTIILCHLSERNSDPEAFRNRVAAAFGVPAYIASKGVTVELNKEVLNFK